MERLKDNDPRIKFKKFQMLDTVSEDALLDFENWVEEIYVGSRSNTSQETLEKEIKIITQALKSYMLRSDVAKKGINSYEKELLAKWKGV